jgi:peptidase MA superfamily protein
VSKLVAVNLAQPIDFYIYATVDDLRATLETDDKQWIAGHADPSVGIVMVVIEPGVEQNILMEQRIPHELMHVMMYRVIGAGYYNIPTWLREGMATLAEIYPNTDYDRVLADAAKSNELIPLNTLCVSFPADIGQAFLAYAESRSFTGYLQDSYGTSGLLKLSTAYADGVDCDRGTELVLGLALPNLEAKWRSSILGQNAWLPALQNMTPYLALLCLVLIFPLLGMLGALRKKGLSRSLRGKS